MQGKIWATSLSRAVLVSVAVVKLSGVVKRFRANFSSRELKNESGYKPLAGLAWRSVRLR